jgi:hypothetical protein
MGRTLATNELTKSQIAGEGGGKKERKCSVSPEIRQIPWVTRNWLITEKYVVRSKCHVFSSLSLRQSGLGFLASLGSGLKGWDARSLSVGRRTEHLVACTQRDANIAYPALWTILTTADTDICPVWLYKTQNSQQQLYLPLRIVFQILISLRYSF